MISWCQRLAAAGLRSRNFASRGTFFSGNVVKAKTPLLSRASRRFSTKGPFPSNAAVMMLPFVLVGLAGVYTGVPVENDAQKLLTSDEEAVAQTRNFYASLDLNDTSIPMKDRMIAQVIKIQDESSECVESTEQGDKRLQRMPYLRDGGKGFGESRVLQDGETYEKAGVNISVIESVLPAASVRQMRAHRFDWWDGESALPYFVAGCSCVVHPRNPHAPTIHFNYRYFEVSSPDGKHKAWWFGGGTDLTPMYLYEQDVKQFHRSLKDACDSCDLEYYPKFKKECDAYFTNTHRGEMRGLGGIFFDDLSDKDPNVLFKFVQRCSRVMSRDYKDIMLRRRNMPYTDAEKRWQQLRRGRYVEFNLIHDRGTKFGLLMKEPRTESILMSLPLHARWEFHSDMGTVPGTREYEIMQLYKNPREWV